jgi:hypothetical protein
MLSIALALSPILTVRRSPTKEHYQWLRQKMEKVRCKAPYAMGYFNSAGIAFRLFRENRVIRRLLKSGHYGSHSQSAY